MATIWEETKTQGAKMKGRPIGEKLEYFWEYYKIHTLIAAGVIIILSSLIHAWVTSKDYALSIVCINTIADSIGVTEEWTGELSSLIEFDPKEYEVYIDTTLMMGMDNTSGNAEYASSQKLAALLSSNSIDIFIADTKIFEQYAQNSCFTDLRDIYSEDELGRLAGSIYYTDRATYSDYEAVDLDVTTKQAGYVIDHHDPSTMKDPVPVGFFAEAGSRLADSGAYSNLPEGGTYQGFPVCAVMGIPANTPRIDAAMTGVGYFLDHTSN